MEELGSIWVYEVNVDELKEKLIRRTFELESLKMEASEEIRKIEENVKNLQDLLKMAYNERDEARAQLQILMEGFLCSNSDKFQTRLPRLRSESPLFIPTKANSSITESNSLSHNSPVDSFFDTVSSPDLSNINMADSTKMGAGAGAVNEQFLIDPSLEIIENIAKEKPLPQKGKLLQAVMKAGPLLQTLLVAGPLPRWRNPPPLEAFKIPALSIRGSQNLNFDGNPPQKSSFLAQKQEISSPYSENFRGSSRMCSASVLSDKGTSPGPCFYIPEGKRQKFQ